MKVLLALCALALAANAQHCYDNTVVACSSTSSSDDLPACNALYSGFHNAVVDLSGYAKSQILFSYDYLLTSTHFGNYQKNRVGFEKLFKKLSDTAWENAIGMMKYITKRGGTVDFQTRHFGSTNRSVEISELQSLAKALDNEKHLAERLHKIHKIVARNNEDHHDPETSHYLEEKFMPQQAKCIRELSGHTNDLKHLLQGTTDSSLALYLFDEYLQKA